MSVSLQVLNCYPLGGSLKIERVDCGLINDTYLLADGSERYILQRLNKIYGPEIIMDLDTISRFVVDGEAKDFTVPRVIKTKDQKLWVESEGRIWRLLSYIPGRTFEKIFSRATAYEAGRVLGLFHQRMSHFGYEFKNPRPPAHNSTEIYRLFRETEMSGTGPDINLLVAKVHKISELLNLKTECQTVIHGDPKISNFIFDEWGKAVGLIDLDGCMRGFLLLELGDAFRSWCGDYEDNPHNFFDLQRFDAAFEGYWEAAGDLKNISEMMQLPEAIKLITLELASRFLRDYFEDKYFGWDRTRYSSRREHNLARTTGQISFYEDIVEKEEEIRKIISDHHHA